MWEQEPEKAGSASTHSYASFASGAFIGSTDSWTWPIWNQTSAICSGSGGSSAIAAKQPSARWLSLCCLKMRPRR